MVTWNGREKKMRKESHLREDLPPFSITDTDTELQQDLRLPLLLVLVVSCCPFAFQLVLIILYEGNWNVAEDVPVF